MWNLIKSCILVLLAYFFFRQQAKQWKVQFFETSAFMKINIEEIFFEAVREIRRFDAAAETSRTGKPPKPYVQFLNFFRSLPRLF